MTLPPLPDELRNWPNDPFAVLGMDPSGDKKAARRAYAARVRQYKPEEVPDEFQRIREAYETVLKYIDWGLRSNSTFHMEVEGRQDPERGRFPEDVPATAEFPVETHPDGREGHPANIDRLFPRDVDDECREHWQLAAAGGHEQAYAGLQASRLQELQRTEVVARLYWLLTLFPELDRDRRPIDWLYDGVRTCGLTDPLPELLRRELISDPSEAVRPECWQAIETCVNMPKLLDLCGWRWQALGRLERTLVIRDDLEQLRPRVANSDPQLWCHLMLLALDHLAWSCERNVRQVFSRYVEEAERAETSGLWLHESLARLDLLVEAARGWRQLLLDERAPKRWIQVVPLVWTLPSDQFRPLLIPLLKEMALAPNAGLKHFDDTIAGSPAAAFQLGTAIESWYSESLDFADASWHVESLRPSVEDFVQRYGRFGYRVSRKRLLDLCLEDSIDPRWFATVLASRGELMGVDCAELADQIGRDSALRYVYLGTRIFLG